MPTTFFQDVDATSPSQPSITTEKIKYIIMIAVNLSAAFIIRSIMSIITATSSVTNTFIKRISRTLFPTSASSSSIVKAVSKTMSRTVPAALYILRSITYSQVLFLLQYPTTTLRLLPNKILSATSSVSLRFIRFLTYRLTLVSPIVPILNKSFTNFILYTFSPVLGIFKKNMSLSGIMGIVITPTVASFVQSRLLELLVTSSATPRLLRLITHILSITSSISLSIVKGVNKIISLGVWVDAAMRRSYTLAFTAISLTVSTLYIQYLLILSIASSVSRAIVKDIDLFKTITSSTSSGMLKTIGKLINISTWVDAVVRRSNISIVLNIVTTSCQTTLVTLRDLILSVTPTLTPTFVKDLVLYWTITTASSASYLKTILKSISLSTFVDVFIRRSNIALALLAKSVTTTSLLFTYLVNLVITSSATLKIVKDITLNWLINTSITLSNVRTVLKNIFIDTFCNPFVRLSNIALALLARTTTLSLLEKAYLVTLSIASSATLKIVKDLSLYFSIITSSVGVSFVRLVNKYISLSTEIYNIYISRSITKSLSTSTESLSYIYFSFFMALSAVVTTVNKVVKDLSIVLVKATTTLTTSVYKSFIMIFAVIANTEYSNILKALSLHISLLPDPIIPIPTIDKIIGKIVFATNGTSGIVDKMLSLFKTMAISTTSVGLIVRQVPVVLLAALSSISYIGKAISTTMFVVLVQCPVEVIEFSKKVITSLSTSTATTTTLIKFIDLIFSLTSSITSTLYKQSFIVMIVEVIPNIRIGKLLPYLLLVTSEVSVSLYKQLYMTLSIVITNILSIIRKWGGC